MKNELLNELQQMSDHDLLIKLHVQLESIVEAIIPIPKMRTRIRVLEVLMALALGGSVTGVLQGFVF